jgi:hypothetical protein
VISLLIAATESNAALIDFSGFGVFVGMVYCLFKKNEFNLCFTNNFINSKYCLYYL